MSANAGGGRTVKSSERTFDVLEILRERNGARVTEVADELDLAKSTVHRYLATLRKREYVVKEGDEYAVGLRFLELGQTARYRKPIYELAEPVVEDLAAETEERAVFLIEEHGQAVYVHRATGEHAVRASPGPGERVPIHATAAGKAILAYLPERRVREILDRRGLPARTQNTITSRNELREELERVREHGYAINQEENVRGVRAVGVPIRPNDRVVGALSISGPIQRMQEKEGRDQQNLLNLLLGSANELEIKSTKTAWTVE